MKPLIPVVVVIVSVAGGLMATRPKAAPPSALLAARSSARKPASVPESPPVKALPQLDSQQRARLLHRIVQSHHQPASPGPAPSAAPSLDSEYIRGQIRALLPLLKECYENTLHTQPRLSGKLVVDFTITGEPGIGGLVSDSSINAAQSTIADPGMRECVQETMYAAQFPAPAAGGEVQVTYPFEFATDK